MGTRKFAWLIAVMMITWTMPAMGQQKLPGAQPTRPPVTNAPPLCPECPPGGGYPVSTTPVPPEQFANSPGGVDMRTGRYNYSHVDLSIGGDPGLSLERTVLSGAAQHTERFGGVSFNWDVFVEERRIQTAESNYISTYDYLVTAYGAHGASFRSLYDPDQSSFVNLSVFGFNRLNFTYTGTGTGTSFRVPKQYILIAEDGTTVSFLNIGSGGCGGVGRCAYASSVVEPKGNRYDLQYDANSRLRAVTSNRGYALLFEYAPATPTVIGKACVVNLVSFVVPTTFGEQICPGGVPTSTYSYTNNLLTGFVDQSGVFSYLGANASAIYDPGASSPSIVNNLDGSDLVTSQSFADGRSLTYAWDLDANMSSSSGFDDGKTHVVGGQYTDQSQRSAAIRYGQYFMGLWANDDTSVATSGPEQITDQLSHSVNYNYCVAYRGDGQCIPGLLQYKVDREGIRTDYTWNGQRQPTRQVVHAKAGSGLPDIVRSWTYDCGSQACIAKPTSVTDARGGTTDYTYDAVHGGVLTESGPADASGVRPVKRSGYVQRYAWISNGAGGYVPAASPVWLLSEERTCRTSATVGGGCAGGAGDEVVTTYEYGPNAGPNNLLLRGVAVSANGQVRRTCYGYDAQGNRISETKPRAGLGVCP